MIEIGRRGLLASIGALFAAPAIVKAASLMPISGDVLMRTGHVPFLRGNQLLTIDIGHARGS